MIVTGCTASPLDLVPQDAGFADSGAEPDGGRDGGPDGGRIREANAVVEPECLDFGVVSTLAPERLSAFVRNVGDAPLFVTGLVVDASQTGVFTVVSPLTGTLAPGDNFEIVVEFQPLASDTYISTLLIHTSDPDEPTLSVCLIGQGARPPLCQFTLEPTALGFGIVTSVYDHRRTLAVRNTGSEDCLVTSARIDQQTDSNFSLTMPPDSVILRPGDTELIEVAYQPSGAGSHAGALEIAFSDETPVVVVPLTATAVEQGLLVSPGDLDFGHVEAGCTTIAETVRVRNLFAESATVTSLVLDDPLGAFTITNGPTLPAAIDPLGMIEFDVTFDPPTSSGYAGAARIEAEVGSSTLVDVVSLSGRSAVGAVQIDMFESVGTQPVDVLFVLHESASMGRYQRAMIPTFDPFTTYARRQGIDYQIGVITMANDQEAGLLVSPLHFGDHHGGPPQNRIIRPTSLPDPETLFRTHVEVGASSRTDPPEAFHTALLATSEPRASGHNAGFLRRDAALALLFILNEDEQTLRAVDPYFEHFVALKGHRQRGLVAASAIAGETPNGCVGQSGSATPAYRFNELVDRTGGVFESICTSDWPATMTRVGDQVFGVASRYPLTARPAPASLEVSIDGTVVSATSPQGTVNWRYNTTNNAVEFAPVILEPGTTVQIRYAVACR